MLIVAVILLAAPQPFDVLPQPLETPPFEYTYNSSPDGAFAETAAALELLSETEVSVLDVEDWFDRVVGTWQAAQFHDGGINSAVTGDLPPGGIQPYIITPGAEYFYLDKVINSTDAVIALYGDPPNRYNVVLNSQILLVLEPGTFRTLKALDFLSYARYRDNSLDADEEQFTFQKIRWAEVRNNVLYVSTMHWTYAESSAGRNAYITALDLETLELLWRTDPLVCNSENFIISGDVIFCGYGFTNEEDYVYVVNRLTGEVTQSIAVQTAPEYFWLRGNRLYVRCYDTECVFAVQ